MAQQKIWGRHKGTVGGNGGEQGRQGSHPFFLPDFPPFIVSTVQTQLNFPADIYPFVWRSSSRHSPSPPASPCVFPLHWRAFRQRADIWFRSPNFSGKTVYFSVRFPHFCHRFAVHFPYDCRPFSIIALPLDSAVLGASARKSQWFQKSSGSLPYVFHTFSMLFPSTCHTFSVH